MEKKGSILDLIFIGILLLSFAVGTLVVYKVSDELNTAFQSNDDITTEGKQSMNTINNMYSGVVDNSFLLLTIGLAIVALAFATLVRIHPIFFVFYFIVLIIIIFISGVFSNIYLEMANNVNLITQANKLSFITNIMYSLPFIVGIFGTLLSIVMYKNYKEQ